MTVILTILTLLRPMIEMIGSRLIFVCALFPWLNKYRIIEKDEPQLADDLDPAVQGEHVNDDEFEAVLPFGQDGKDPDVGTRQSSLMTKYKSLRHNFNDAEDEEKQSMKTRTSRNRASMGASLLAQQLNGSVQQGVLQEKNDQLELQVVSLQTDVENLEAEVAKLKKRLRREKSKRQLANSNADLNDTAHGSFESLQNSSQHESTGRAETEKTKKRKSSKKTKRESSRKQEGNQVSSTAMWLP